MALIQDILSVIDEQTLRFAKTGYEAAASALLPTFRLCLTALCAMIGVNLMTQTIPMTLSNGMSIIARVGLAVTFFSSWSQFEPVYTALTEAPSDLGGIVLEKLGFEGADSGLYAGLDQLYLRSIAAGETISREGGWFTGSLSSVIVFAAAVIFSVICVFVIGMSKIILAIIVIMAPLAVLFTLFKQTTSLFDGWLRAAAQASLMPLLMAVAAGMIIIVADTVAPTATSQAETIGDLLNFLFVIVLGAFVVIRVPGLAESMSAANTGLGAMAASTFRSSSGAARKTLQGADVGGAGGRSRPKGQGAASSKMGAPNAAKLAVRLAQAADRKPR